MGEFKSERGCTLIKASVPSIKHTNPDSPHGESDLKMSHFSLLNLQSLFIFAIIYAKRPLFSSLYSFDRLLLSEFVLMSS